MNNEVRIPRDSSFKVLLLGDAGTGKTTFVSRFIKASPLKNDPKLEFTAQPAHLPPETEIDRAAQDEHEALLEAALSQALSDDDL